MNTIEQQAVEYGEALNDIADALDAPTGSSPAQVVELARKAMCQRQPSTEPVGLEAKRCMDAHEASALDNSTNAEQMYWMRKYEQLEAEYKRLSAQPAFAARAEAWITGGKGPMPTMSEIESVCGMLAEPAASAPAQSADAPKYCHCGSEMGKGVCADGASVACKEMEECEPEHEPDFKCATFDQSAITPEIRAKMDADRAKAEAARKSAEPDAKRDAGKVPTTQELIVKYAKIPGLAEWVKAEAEVLWGIADNQEDKRNARRLLDASEHLTAYSELLKSAQATQRRCTDAVEALEYWLPEREPLYAQHDEVSIAHRRKWHEAKSLVKQWRPESAKEGQP